MLEDPSTPTILGMTAEEWHAIGDGFPDGFQGPTFGPFVVPEEAKNKARYYKAANIGGRILKIVLYAVAIKFLGMASGGFI